MVEEFVAIYGEGYRKLIEHSLAWLDEREPLWKLDKPFDRHEYIEAVVGNAVPCTEVDK